MAAIHVSSGRYDSLLLSIQRAVASRDTVNFSISTFLYLCCYHLIRSPEGPQYRFHSWWDISQCQCRHEVSMAPSAFCFLLFIMILVSWKVVKAKIGYPNAITKGGDSESLNNRLMASRVPKHLGPWLSRKFQSSVPKPCYALGPTALPCHCRSQHPRTTRCFSLCLSHAWDSGMWCDSWQTTADLLWSRRVDDHG